MDRIIELVVALLVAVGSGAPTSVPAGPPDGALAEAEARVASVFEQVASLEEHVAAAVAWAGCLAANATSAPVPRHEGFDPTDGCEFDRPAAGDAGAAPVGGAPPVAVPAGPPADAPSGHPDPAPVGPPAGAPPELPAEAPEGAGSPPVGVPAPPGRP